MHEDHLDASLQEFSEWAKQQAKRLAANFGLDGAADRNMFALAQTAKLGEEVGELQADVLGAIRYCRADKISTFTQDTLAGELADVMVCTMLLARSLRRRSRQSNRQQDRVPQRTAVLSRHLTSAPRPLG